MNITGLKMPTGGRQTSWAIYKNDRGVELGSTEKPTSFPGSLILPPPEGGKMRDPGNEVAEKQLQLSGQSGT